MPEYHLYYIDQKSRVAKRQDYRAGDDAEAYEYAVSLSGEYEIEVWQQANFVARLAREDDAAGRRLSSWPREESLPAL